MNPFWIILGISPRPARRCGPGYLLVKTRSALAPGSPALMQALGRTGPGCRKTRTSSRGLRENQDFYGLAGGELGFPFGHDDQRAGAAQVGDLVRALPG